MAYNFIGSLRAGMEDADSLKDRKLRDRLTQRRIANEDEDRASAKRKTRAGEYAEFGAPLETIERGELLAGEPENYVSRRSLADEQALGLYKELRTRLARKGQARPVKEPQDRPYPDYDLQETNDALQQYAGLRAKGIELTDEQAADEQALMARRAKRMGLPPAPTPEPEGPGLLSRLLSGAKNAAGALGRGLAGDAPRSPAAPTDSILVEDPASGLRKRLSPDQARIAISRGGRQVR